jgi:hypothetical protein
MKKRMSSTMTMSASVKARRQPRSALGGLQPIKEVLTAPELGTS